MDLNRRLRVVLLLSTALKQGHLPTSRGMNIGSSQELHLSNRDRRCRLYLLVSCRGPLHFAGINTFLEAPYVKDVADLGNCNATIIGVTKQETLRSNFRFAKTSPDRAVEARSFHVRESLREIASSDLFLPVRCSSLEGHRKSRDCSHWLRSGFPALFGL